VTAVANAAVTALRGIGGSHAVPLPLSQMDDFFRLVGLNQWFAVSEKWSGPVPGASGDDPDNAAGSSGAW
jgi:hypothetical protein